MNILGYIFSFSQQSLKLTKFWEYPQLMWMLCYLKQKLCMVLAYLKSQWFSTTEVPKLDQSFKITSFQKASGIFLSLNATFQLNISNTYVVFVNWQYLKLWKMFTLINLLLMLSVKEKQMIENTEDWNALTEMIMVDNYSTCKNF